MGTVTTCESVSATDCIKQIIVRSENSFVESCRKLKQPAVNVHAMLKESNMPSSGDS